jgi:hypothetical protein
LSSSPKPAFDQLELIHVSETTAGALYGLHFKLEQLLERTPWWHFHDRKSLKVSIAWAKHFADFFHNSAQEKREFYGIKEEEEAT